jgi:hypothetical protein
MSPIPLYDWPLSALIDVSVSEGRLFMRFIFLALALILFFTWIGAFVVFHVAAALIHLLLVLAVVFLVIHLFSGRRAA